LYPVRAHQSTRRSAVCPGRSAYQLFMNRKDGMSMDATLKGEVGAPEATLQRNEAGRNLWSDAWSRLRKNVFAMGGLLVLLGMILAAVLAPWIAPMGPETQNYMHMMEGPSQTHLLGTDNFGRDILSRIIHGAQISLRLGLFGTLVGATIGTLIGAISGYYGGWVDALLMRILDVQMAFPGL